MTTARWLGKEDEKPLVVVDTPGLSDSAGQDERIIIHMVDYVKTKLGKLDFIVLTLNGAEPRIDYKTMQIIDIFCDTFGQHQVFNNMGILYTRWSYSDQA